MSVDLNPAVQKFVDDLVQSGTYDSPEGVVEAGLAVLKQQRREHSFKPGELDLLLAEGMRDIENGNLHDGELAFDELDQLSADRRAGQSQ